VFSPGVIDAMAGRILLVEDDDNLRSALARLLVRTGYIVMEAGDGRVALLQMSQQPADLVITDMLMPVMEGAQTILALRRMYPGVKIIAISGGGICSAESCLAIARALGAQKVLTKPLIMAEFLDAVRDLTDK
jgi:CheY-like chemotaxis protein